MKIQDFKNEFGFNWNNDKTLLELKGISVNQLGEILSYLGIDNYSNHDVYIHGFANEENKQWILKNGLNYPDLSRTATSTMHLLPNTEPYALNYEVSLASYIDVDKYKNGLIAVIPEVVEDLYLGKSNRQMVKQPFVSPRYGFIDDFIYSCSGNQNECYSPYDQFFYFKSMLPELLFGFVSLNIEDTSGLYNDRMVIKDRNAKILNLEINPKFVLFEDYIQKDNLTNLEVLKQKLNSKTFYDFIKEYNDLNKELSDNSVAMLSILYPHALQTREEYLNIIKGNKI